MEDSDRPDGDGTIDTAHAVLSRLLVRNDATATAPPAPEFRPLRSVVEDLWGRRAIVLTDVELPRCRSTVDVVVVSPAGVWALHVLAGAGTPELREVGGFFHTDRRLFVDDRDRSADLDELVWQGVACVGAITPAFDRFERAAELVSTALVLCRTDGGCDTGDRPFQLEDHWICAPSGLAELMSGAEVLDDHDVATIESALRGDPDRIGHAVVLDRALIDPTDGPLRSPAAASRSSIGR